MQFTVSVSDQSDPEQTSSATVRITLSRDEYPPTVDRAEYTLTIEEGEEVGGVALLRIQAQDRDLKVTLVNKKGE